MEQQTVLVIDDDAAIRDIVSTLLTDMRMPVMDGRTPGRSRPPGAACYTTPNERRYSCAEWQADSPEHDRGLCRLSVQAWA